MRRRLLAICDRLRSTPKAYDVPKRENRSYDILDFLRTPLKAQRPAVPCSRVPQTSSGALSRRACARIFHMVGDFPPSAGTMHTESAPVGRPRTHDELQHPSRVMLVHQRITRAAVPTIPSTERSSTSCRIRCDHDPRRFLCRTT